MSYDFFEHRHRFSVWAAARAAQRGLAGATVDNLREALEASSIVDFLRDPNSLDIDRATFETRHREWCNSIVGFLEEKGIRGVSFGRAAKLVAVYIKSMVVIGSDSESSLAIVAHPPIDRILLKNLGKSRDIHSAHKPRWLSIKWTTLDERSYYALIAELLSVVSPGEAFWKLEQYWTVTNE